ncbi:hypothetical protein F4821DRAFT_153406 [Hypoxylon rubiginosum]|uniref:Uncharacterized protein n=1 Tax=Hypoxylon rubiginosum TaxID=110542 RepID=A0ACC0CYD0_9PEZI|nr:hypothetical protein F4821DRAFT_153406 [Hypoxylon rubiginosum]
MQKGTCHFLLGYSAFLALWLYQLFNAQVSVCRSLGKIRLMNSGFCTSTSTNIHAPTHTHPHPSTVRGLVRSELRSVNSHKILYSLHLTPHTQPHPSHTPNRKCADSSHLLACAGCRTCSCSCPCSTFRVPCSLFLFLTMERKEMASPRGRHARLSGTGQYQNATITGAAHP